MHPRTCSGESSVVRVMSVVVLVFLCVPCFVCAEVGDYTHEWAAHVEGGDEKAHEIARRHDFDVITKVRRERERMLCVCLCVWMRERV